MSQPGQATKSGDFPGQGATLALTGSVRKFVVSLLRAAGAAEGDAATMADGLIAAEEYGHVGHGLARLPHYVKRLRAGGMRSARPVLARGRGAVEVYDGQDGFGHTHLRFAARRAAELARLHGVGAVGVSRSNHAGALGLCAREVAVEGTIVVLMSNAPAVLAAPSGTIAVVGTNPLALAAPIPGDEPLVCDGGMSQVSRGLLLRALQEGNAIPLGWAFDAAGEPTTDPGAGLSGTLAPLGGAKGFALAVLVEVLTGVLLGPRVGPEIGDFFSERSDDPQGISHLALAFEPTCFGEEGGYEQRITRLRDAILASGEPGATRVPGSRARRAPRAEELRVAATLASQLDELAAELGAPAFPRGREEARGGGC